jgi:hypothetical protein
MLAQVLYNLENGQKTTGMAGFSDVAADAWYADAVIWASEKKIVSGYGNGKFGAGDSITREQLAVILYRYSGSSDVSATLESFTDAGNASTYAVDALSWAVQNGIMSGKGNGILDPKGTASRAEVATMLMNYCKNIA